MATNLLGCAQTTWHKSGASESDFYRNKSFCESRSIGAIPMQGQETTIHTGKVYDSIGNSVDYTGTSKKKVDLNYEIGDMLMRERLFDDCMHGQGYVKRLTSKLNETQNSTRYLDVRDGKESEKVLEIKETYEAIMDTNCYSKPNTYSITAGSLKNGDKVEVLSLIYIKNENYPIPIKFAKIENEYGFAYILFNEIKPIRHEEIKRETIVKTTSLTMLRSIASYSSDTTAKIPPKTSLIVLQQEGSWIKVNYEGTEGYVAKSWVVVDD
jgi:uncharacterized protein YgiM (DUF1202 family)